MHVLLHLQYEIGPLAGLISKPKPPLANAMVVMGLGMKLSWIYVVCSTTRIITHTRTAHLHVHTPLYAHMHTHANTLHTHAQAHTHVPYLHTSTESHTDTCLMDQCTLQRCEYKLPIKLGRLSNGTLGQSQNIIQKFSNKETIPIHTVRTSVHMYKH